MDTPFWDWLLWLIIELQSFSFCTMFFTSWDSIRVLKDFLMINITYHSLKSLTFRTDVEKAGNMIFKQLLKLKDLKLKDEDK